MAGSLLDENDGSGLSENQQPLVRQVQIATDAAKTGGARLAGVDMPSFPDTEASFDEVESRTVTPAHSG